MLHLEQAFHGRTGYTMSLTNTDPNKVARFPKFDWPRIPAPSINGNADVEAAERTRSPRRAPRSRPTRTTSPASSSSRSRARAATTTSGREFLQAMQALCREFDALFILDEVQTGVGMTGTAWAYQQLGVQPDVVAFGKKAQVCGIMAGGRVDEVPDNVFAVSSRINSTWGGNLTDMVRARRILEVIESDGLIERARRRSARTCSHGLQRARREARRRRRRARPRADVRVHAAVGGRCATRSITRLRDGRARAGARLRRRRACGCARR